MRVCVCAYACLHVCMCCVNMRAHIFVCVNSLFFSVKTLIILIIKEAFYNQLSSVLSGIPRTDKLLLIGDFNARIGRENDKWPLVMGKHGIGKCNSNGELLLALCSEFELIVTNTMFKQKDERKTTLMQPRSRHWRMIDFIITRCLDKMDIHSTRVMRGATCWTEQ